MSTSPTHNLIRDSYAEGSAIDPVQALTHYENPHIVNTTDDRCELNNSLNETSRDAATPDDSDNLTPTSNKVQSTKQPNNYKKIRTQLIIAFVLFVFTFGLSIAAISISEELETPDTVKTTTPITTTTLKPSTTSTTDAVTTTKEVISTSSPEEITTTGSDFTTDLLMTTETIEVTTSTYDVLEAMIYEREMDLDQVRAVRLRGSSAKNEGRVEIFYGGVWGTISSVRNFDTKEGDLTCHMLGYRNATKVLPSSHNEFGLADGVIWTDNVVCNGTEYDIRDCVDQNAWGVLNAATIVAGHTQDAGLRCFLPP